LFSATGGASRRNADALPVRSIAGYCSFWPICGASRPSESCRRARSFF
jgi:hypothetical protein